MEDLALMFLFSTALLSIFIASTCFKKTYRNLASGDAGSAAANAIVCIASSFLFGYVATLIIDLVINRL